jgi:DNA modification methylase
MTEGNVLYYGDNLDVLRRHVRDESVDLVYLDPPFNSNANYNVLFAEHGEKAAAQVRAFEDTWVWDRTARLTYEETVEAGGKLADAMRAFRTMLGASDMLAYLAMMAPRLAELHRALKSTGSLWLHCDPTASHYLKLVLDALFKPANFVNEVVWKRSDAKGDMGQGAKHLGRVNDVLLVYAKSDTRTWNPVYTPLDPDYVERFYRYADSDGRRYKLDNMEGPGGAAKGNPFYEVMGVSRHWRYSRESMARLIEAGRVVQTNPGTVPMYKRFLDESKGTPLTSNWSDIRFVGGWSKERLGYPTQKPIALLERILAIATNPGDTILDPFCGCGTAIDAAQKLGRRWIGIDVTHLSIGLIKHRLTERYGADVAKAYRVVGEPTTVDDAAVLARDDPFQFQAWALGLVGARIVGSDKKGGDRGIDGRLYFHDSANGSTRQIVFSVKAGKLVPTYVRDLRGVIDREDAEIGVLLSFDEPSPGMRSEAAEAGFYESPWGKHPRIQLRTIRELLEGKGVDYPHVGGANVTLRRARPDARMPAPSIPMFEADAD